MIDADALPFTTKILSIQAGGDIAVTAEGIPELNKTLSEITDTMYRRHKPLPRSEFERLEGYAAALEEALDYFERSQVSAGGKPFSVFADMCG